MAALVKHRIAALIVVCLVAAGATGLSVVGGRDSTAAADRHLAPTGEVTKHPYFLFRSTILDHHYGRLALAPASDPDQVRAMTPLSCARVTYSTIAKRGVCLSAANGLFGTAKAIIFNQQFEPVATIALPGYPNRAQVSPDGRYAAVTDFVSGDSYAAASFSTRTYIIDLNSDRITFDLEKMHVTENGRRFYNVNFNFWGVTFAHDDQHFYATLGSGSTTYLVEGDIATRTAAVLRTGVECPSLSPDGTRLAFKRRLPGTTVRWRLSVLDLATLKSYPLAETRDVDDQAYWLNNTTVAYGLEKGGGSTATGISVLTAGGSIPTNMWEVPANGTGHPRLLMTGAWSAVLVP
jgi:hypothetical protein